MTRVALVLLVLCALCAGGQLVSLSAPAIDGVWNYRYGPGDACVATVHIEKLIILIVRGGPIGPCFFQRGLWTGSLVFYRNDSALLFLSSVDGTINENQDAFEAITRNGTGFGVRISFPLVTASEMMMIFNDGGPFRLTRAPPGLLDGVYDANVFALPSGTNLLGRFRWKRLSNPGLAWYLVQYSLFVCFVFVEKSV